MKPRNDSPDERRDRESFLPLKPDVFLVLTILGAEDAYGYRIIRAAEEMSAGRVRLRAGALYRRLRWMLDEGLIRELERRPVEEGGDERRRWYRITPFGREVAEAEARRMADLLEVAGRRGLAPETGGGR